MKKSIIFLLVFIMLGFSGCSFFAKQASGEKAAQTGSGSEQEDKKTNIGNTNTGSTNTVTDAVNGQDTGLKAGVMDNLRVPDTRAESPAIIQTPVIKSENGKMHVTLYYQDKEGYLIPMTRKFTSQAGIARAAVNALVDNSLNREEMDYYGIYPVLPKGTEVLGINIREGMAAIDFNSSFLNFKNKSEEKNVISSVVYTLTEFSTIRSVKILVNGRLQQKLKFGTDLSSPLNRDNVLINSGKVNVSSGYSKLDAFFLRNAGGKSTVLVPVSKEFVGMEKSELPVKLIEVLASDTKVSGLFSQIPEKTVLRSSTSRGGTLVLDFNGEFTKYGGTSREDGILKQIFYSMKQFPEVDKLRILVEGKEGHLPEGTDISKDIPLPYGINLLAE